MDSNPWAPRPGTTAAAQPAGDAEDLLGDEHRVSDPPLGAEPPPLTTFATRPRWHQALAAAAVALAVASLVIPDVSAAAVVPLVVIWSPWLLTAARHGTDGKPLPSGPRARRALVLASLALGVLLVLAVLIKVSSLSSWWGLAPAAASFVGVLVLGLHHDAAVRVDLAEADDTA